MIKRILAIYLTFITTVQVCFSSEWVTITAENGKNADLDLSSVKMAVDTVEYDIKTEKDGFLYINRFSSELYKEGTPTAVIQYSKYKGDKLIKSEIAEKRTYKPLKQGTLQAEIFDVLSKELQEQSFNSGQEQWDKYLKRQKKRILKQWKPRTKAFKYYDKNYVRKESECPVYHNNVSLQVDSNGAISERNASDYSNQLYQVRSFEALPEDYTGKTFNLQVDMKYYKYVGALKDNKKPVVKNSPVEATVTVAKNSRPPILGHIQYGFLCAYKKMTGIGDKFLSNKQMPFLLDLICIPVELGLTIIIPLTGYIIFGILFPLSGGDVEDLM